MTSRPQLQPVRREEIIDVLSFAIRCEPRRSVIQLDDELVARVAAQRIARHLKIAGFVVMKSSTRRVRSKLARMAGTE
jgi:hypothetical protein